MAIRALRSARVLPVVALAVSLAWGTNTPPDAGRYTSTDSTVYSFIDLTLLGGSASVLSNTDDGVALLTVPFSFAFYGNGYRLLCVSANGIAYFVTGASQCTAVNDFQNLDLTAAAAPGDLPAVAPYWTDLSFQVPGGGAVYYQTQGVAPNRKFIVQWNNAYPQAPVASPDPVTFELVLYESSNQVLFQYKTVNLGSANQAHNGAQSTVGIRAAGGNSNGRQTQWSYDAAVLTDASAILFAPGYQWIPPAQVSVTASGMSYNRSTGVYAGTMTLKNIGGSTLAGPLQLLISGLPAGVTLSNATASYAGNPYISVTTPASLAAGQSVTVAVQFKNSNNVNITSVPIVYSGSLQ